MNPRLLPLLVLAFCPIDRLYAEDESVSVPELCYDFSNSTEDYKATCGELKTIAGLGAHGESCLSVNWSCPGETRIAKQVSLRGKQIAEAALELFVPADAPYGLQVSLFFADKDGLWFQAISDQRLKRGTWQTMDFDIAPSSIQVSPVHHEAVWNSYYSNRITSTGIQLFSPSDWKGSVLIQSLKFRNRSESVSAMRILHLKTPSATPHAFEQLELEFEISKPVANPCNPNEISVDAVLTPPSGIVARVPCFYYQPYRRELTENQIEVLTPSGRAGWRLRYTPVESGNYRWNLVVTAGKDTLSTKEQVLAVEQGKPSGFVRASKKDPHYFETADGEFFYPIGQNIHAPFDRRCAEMLRVPVLPNRGTFAYDDYFQKMAAHGENAVVIWMCNWWLSIEWTDKWKGYGGLTDFNLANAWRLDQLLESAKRNGIYVHIVLDNHGKLSKFVDPEWADNPYSSALGGPCSQPEGFFSSPAAFEIYKKRLRYTVARWSSFPNLLGFELMGEMNLVGSDRRFTGNPEESLWCKRACAFLREADPYRHLVTVHYSNDFSTVDSKVASLPEIDYLVGDAYKAGGSIVPLMVKTAEENSRYGKPTFSTEFGGNWNGTTPARLHADLHAGLWSNAMTVTAAAPFIWWFDYVDRYNLYSEYQSLVNFMKVEDRRGCNLKSLSAAAFENGKESTSVRVVTLKNNERASFWVYDTLDSEIMPENNFTRTHSGLSFNLEGLSPGSYSLELWDTFKGIIIERRTISVSSEPIVVKLPDFKIDIAGKVLPEREPR